jgi:DNA-binding CsgD family transcriptional regulator/tetratricopeptide (TPR) repeat protein
MRFHVKHLESLWAVVRFDDGSETKLPTAWLPVYASVGDQLRVSAPQDGSLLFLSQAQMPAMFEQLFRPLPTSYLEAMLRLTVIEGEFTVGTANAVIDAASLELEPQPMLDLLASRNLILVRSSDNDESFYVLPKIVRNQLLVAQAQSQHFESTLARHATHFLELAEHGSIKTQGVGSEGLWLEVLVANFENFRKALSWFLAPDAVADTASMGLRLATALFQLWHRQAHIEEGMKWLTLALERSKATDLRVAALGQQALANLAMFRGQFDLAQRAFEESILLFRRANNLIGEADVAIHYGYMLLRRDKLGAARLMFENALFVVREHQEPILEGSALGLLATVAVHQHDPKRAEALYLESLALRQSLGDQIGVARMLTHLGMLMARRGDFERARAMQLEALELRRVLKDELGIESNLQALGWIASRVGNLDEARSLYLTALERAFERGDPEWYANTLEGLAHVAVRCFAYGFAAKLHGLIEAIRETNQLNRSALLEGEYRACVLQILVGTLDHDVLEAARLEGVALSFEDVRSQMAALSFSASPTEISAWSKAGVLSRRELTVLRLVANGESNSAIAKTLSITPNSVKTYLTRVMDKLGVNKRAHAVAIAVSAGWFETN